MRAIVMQHKKHNNLPRTTYKSKRTQLAAMSAPNASKNPMNSQTRAPVKNRYIFEGMVKKRFRNSRRMEKQWLESIGARSALETTACPGQANFDPGRPLSALACKTGQVTFWQKILALSPSNINQLWQKISQRLWRSRPMGDIIIMELKIF